MQRARKEKKEEKKSHVQKPIIINISPRPQPSSCQLTAGPQIPSAYEAVMDYAEENQGIGPTAFLWPAYPERQRLL